MKTRKLHLSLLMFFQLAVVGAYMPILSIYFKDYLGLSSLQIGIILSIASIPSILAPFISTWIVDRIITSRRFLAISHLIAAILITIISFQKNYSTVLLLYFIYTIFQIPTSALVTALVFHNIKDRNIFGTIRLWGTIGWISAGWIVSFIWKFMGGLENMPLALRLSALFSIIVVLLTLKLPKLKLDHKKKVTILPQEAITVLLKPEIILLFILVLIGATADKFVVYGMPIFLKDLGILQENMLIILSFSQLTEIFMLLILSKIIKSIGFKNIFTLGLTLSIARYLILWLNGPLLLTVLGISLHGFVYALFYSAASIYLDNFTDNKSRAGVHQLFSLTYIGIAGFIGNILAGNIAENFQYNGLVNFKIFWFIPGIMSIVTLFVLTLKMRRITTKSKA